MNVWLQLFGFMVVGALGVGVNGVVYEFFMKFKFGRKVVISRFKNVTIAWGLGILFAMVFNFLLNKFLVFQV